MRIGLVDDLLRSAATIRSADSGSPDKDDLAFATSRRTQRSIRRSTSRSRPKTVTLRLPGLEAAFGRVFANDPHDWWLAIP
jgi:hypothetical protein